MNMKTIRNNALTLCVMLLGLTLGSALQADPVNMRILENTDGSLDIFIGDIHRDYANDDAKAARDELCTAVKSLGKSVCCVVEDMCEKGRHEKFDAYLGASDDLQRKFFLAGLHEQLKKENIEAHNAECRFANNLSIRDMLEETEKTLAESKSYDDKEWNDYYARARARVGINLGAWQEIIKRDPLVADMLCQDRVYDVNTLYSDRYLSHLGLEGTGSDLMDVRGINFGRQANKKITLYIFGLTHNDAIIHSKKMKGAKEIFTYGFGDAYNYDAQQPLDLSQVGSISIGAGLEAFFKGFPHHAPHNAAVITDKKTHHKRSKSL